jgi:hypothetical protein
MRMNKTRALTVAVFLAALALFAFTGCGPKGADGTSYMALDWVFAPVSLYFPAMPSSGLAGVYYYHPEGTYYGEYIAWDGTYYSFTYSIEVNEGEYGVMGLPGPDGADRYYTMYLYSTGPELYYVDDEASRSLAKTAEGSELPAEPEVLRERSLAEAQGLAPSGSQELINSEAPIDPSAYGLGNAESYSYEKSGPGYRLRIEGQRYRPLPR